ncbi:MAG: hypothetical protein V4457_05935 [Pseudomonadota bacterium]
MSLRKRRSLIYTGPTGAQGGSLTRRYNPGHYIALQKSQIFSGSSYVGIPHAAAVNNVGPVAPKSAGLLVPHAWNEMEPNGATDPADVRFDLSRLDSEVAQCAAYNTNNGAGVQYILKLVVKAFGNSAVNPLPVDLAAPIGHVGDANYSPSGYCTYDPGNASVPPSYGTWRHHPTISSRFAVLVQKLGAHFDGNPNWGGICTQETATGFTPNFAVDGYTPALYMTALINEIKNISNASPHSRAFPFINFMPGVSSDQATINLATVVATAQQYGAVVAFPDLVAPELEPGNIAHRVYDIIQAYRTGGTVTRTISGSQVSVSFAAQGATGGSIQSAEWTNGEAPAPHPASTYPVSLEDLYNLFTASFTYKPSGGYPNAHDRRPGSSLPSPLDGQFLFSDWHTTGTPQFNPTMANIIAANQFPSSFVPSV